jgi:predicted dehydrogenase
MHPKKILANARCDQFCINAIRHHFWEWGLKMPRTNKKESSSRRKIRYAVVGLGHIAQVAILPAFKTAKNSELASIVSGDQEKRQKLEKKYRLDHVYSYGEYGRALSEVDAVYLALPNHMHREYAVRAAEAGVNILCEKPMAVTGRECEEMIRAAEDNGVKLMIAYRLHFEASNLEAIQLGESGKLGDLRFFTSEFAQQVADDNLRVREDVAHGGGPMYDMGVYCVNAARYLFADEPTHVFALTANNGEERFKQTEEMTSVAMRFPHERIATFTCSFGAVDISRYTLIGTKGLVTLDPAYDYSKPHVRRLTIGEKTNTKKYPKRDQFAAEIEYFSDCVLNNEEPEPSGLEGLADVRVVEAIYESARSKKVLELPELPKKRRPSMQMNINRPGHDKPKPVHAKSPSGEAA